MTCFPDCVISESTPKLFKVIEIGRITELSEESHCTYSRGNFHPLTNVDGYSMALFKGDCGGLSDPPESAEVTK